MFQVASFLLLDFKSDPFPAQWFHLKDRPVAANCWRPVKWIPYRPIRWNWPQVNKPPLALLFYFLWCRVVTLVFNCANSSITINRRKNKECGMHEAAAARRAHACYYTVNEWVELLFTWCSWSEKLLNMMVMLGLGIIGVSPLKL